MNLTRLFISLFGFLTYLLATTLTLTSASPIVTLTDANFEHQTQASTGMTTGSWFVLFHSNSCPHCKAIMEDFHRLAEDEQVQEAGIVLSSINVYEHKQTSTRFMIRGFPTLIFLHKHSMYQYKGPRDYDHLKDFILSGYNSIDPMSIPLPPSKFDQYKQLLKAIGLELKDSALGNQGYVGYAILSMVLMLVGIFVYIVLLLFVMPAKSNSIAKKEN